MPLHQKKNRSEGAAGKVLETIGKIIPGFHGFFKKMEQSKTFGVQIGEIRKEIERRFGGARK